jgi:hypothetical protein
MLDVQHEVVYDAEQDGRKRHRGRISTLAHSRVAEQYRRTHKTPPRRWRRDHERNDVDDISRENAAISAAWREHKAEPSDAENHVTCCLLDGFTAGKRFAQPSPEAIRRVAERIADRFVDSHSPPDETVAERIAAILTAEFIKGEK